MFLTVIIPTRNRAKLLQKALGSLLKQTYPQDSYEVIVIDNGSADDTTDVCKEYGQKFKNFQYLYDDKPGLHVGRHVGLNLSNGSVLVYADDDIYALPTWLASIAESFAQSKVGLVGGKNIPEYEIEPPKWVDNLWIKNRFGKYISEFSVLDLGETIKEIPPQFVFGCNFSIKKDVLLEIGGFHPDGLPSERKKFRGDGETAVAMGIKRLGYKTLYHPGASVYHWVSKQRLDIKYLEKRSYLQGISDSYSSIREKGKVDGSISLNGMILLNKLKANVLNWSGKENQMKKTMKLAYLEGFKYHQSEAKNDKNLLSWVLKENYMDDC